LLALLVQFCAMRSTWRIDQVPAEHTGASGGHTSDRDVALSRQKPMLAEWMHGK
jgi:hypothetical protein